MATSSRGPTRVFILVADIDVVDTSRTRRVLQASLEVLTAPQYTVTITDLAKDGWLEPLSVKDFTKISDPIHINLHVEQQISPLTQKIIDEQNKILQCDLFLILAPLSWFGPPSLFFSWWHRVVTAGKLWSPSAMHRTGAFARKRALAVMVSQEKQSAYGKDTLNGTVEELLYPITHGMLYPTGFKIHRAQALYMPNPALYDEVLSKWQTALRDLEDRTCILLNQPTDYVNWTLNTPEKERKNDLDMLARIGDMSLQEATMKLNAPLE
jgi:NAD(P)H dehydrogenase (quinone)